MNRNKGVRGAVSVFLVMILVPCILISSVFVDLGKVYMSKSMAASAADLALNSLMTNYDADLSEWYGMAASCQNIEEFYEGSAQFFLRTLSSRGLEEEEIIRLSSYYAQFTGDETIYDLLQIESLTAPSEMISPITKIADDASAGEAVAVATDPLNNANLTNATLLKDQTVEFMKYRAPIELTLGIIDKLKKDSSASDAVNAEENKKLVDAKTEYYKAEGELLAAVFNTYVAIYNYYDTAKTNGLTNEKLETYATRLTEYRDVYAEIFAIYVEYLIHDGKLTIFDDVSYGLDKFDGDVTRRQLGAQKTDEDGKKYYLVTPNKLGDLIDGLNSSIDTFETNLNTYMNQYSDKVVLLLNNLPGDDPSSSNAIQWWRQMEDIISPVHEAADAVLLAYAKLNRASEEEDKLVHSDDITSDDWKDCLDAMNRAEEVHELYLEDDAAGYLEVITELAKISSENGEKISASTHYIEVDGEEMSVANAISYIHTQLASTKTELDNYVALLNLAIDGNESDKKVDENDKIKSLDSLKVLIETQNEMLVKWNNTANETALKTANKSGGPSMAELDQQEIADIKRLCENLDEAMVEQLKTRLINIRSQIQSVIDGIGYVAICGTSVKNIKKYGTFKSKIKSDIKVPKDYLTNDKVNEYIESKLPSAIAPSLDKDEVMTLSNTDNPAYNPQINPDTRQVATPEFFTYLFEEFKKPSKNQLDEQKKNLKEEQSTMDNAEDSAKKDKESMESGGEAGDEGEGETNPTGRYTGGGTDIAKEFSGSERFGLLEGAVSGVSDLIESLLELDITNIRDDLYVTAYIMNMFSYGTYENEGRYGLVENPTELTLGNHLDKYKDVMGSATEEKTWLSERPQDAYNKSLTNKMINLSNNAAYGAEVEYILYGGREGTTNEDNVKSAYGDIFTVRYVLNLVSGFANFWSAPKNMTALFIDVVANSIAAATAGIIPAPLTKVVLIPILTLLETSNDLDRLQAGFPVELYKKSHKEWWIKVPDETSVTDEKGEIRKLSIKDLTDILEGGFVKNLPNPGEGIFYSDYLTLFVYLGLKSKAAESMYQRMAEVMQANIRKLSGNNEYTMQKAKVYFKLEAVIRVQPLMVALPIFNGYDHDLTTKTDWCTYKITTVRGYS